MNEELLYDLLVNIDLRTAEAQRRLQGFEQSVGTAQEAIDPAFLTSLARTEQATQKWAGALQVLAQGLRQGLGSLAQVARITGQLHPSFATLGGAVASFANNAVMAFQIAADSSRSFAEKLQGYGELISGIGRGAVSVIMQTGMLAAEVETLWTTLATTARVANQ